MRLREVGFSQIDHAHDGQVALDRITHGDYGLVVSDWALKSVNGLELLKAVRADPRTRSLPFVLMTDQIEIDMVIAARQAGVSGYLVKPFSEDLLKQKLTTILDQSLS